MNANTGQKTMPGKETCGQSRWLLSQVNIFIN